MTTSIFSNEISRLARRVRRRVHLAVRGEAPNTYFDLHDLDHVNRVLVEGGGTPLQPNPSLARESVDGAARFLLALLASTPRLRRLFPRALSQGPGGAFATWLVEHGARELGLSETALANITQAFTGGYFARGEKLLDIRNDLCREFPLAVTPAQRGHLIHWHLRFGHESDASLLDLLWYLYRMDESPDRGLGAMYLLKPQWQEWVPHGLTVFGWDMLKDRLAAEYGQRSRWFRKASHVTRYRPWDELAFLLRARRELKASFPTVAIRNGDTATLSAWFVANGLSVPSPEWFTHLAEDVRAGRPEQPGINVLSLFRYTSGLQQAAIGTVQCLTHAGVSTELRDIPVPHKREVRDRDGFVGLERFDVSLIITGLDTPPLHAYHLASLHPQPGTYRIATWWWELETVPDSAQEMGRDVDEIWAPTSFIAKALEPLGRPVETMLPAVQLPAFTPRSKAQVGLSPEKFSFLFVFDMNSRMPRKNPLGLIQAFRLAFQPGEAVELVIKVSPQERFYPEWWSELRAAAAEAGVTLIDRSLSRDELLALMNAADAYVSLHRSEGFGLTMAEAMLLGKPTIATGYSGNLDFMTPANSYLVNYQPVKLAEEIAPYPRGATWAEPNVHHAAMLMSRVFEYPAEAKAIGERARAELQELLSVEAAGRRMAERLKEIRQGRLA